MDTEHPLTGGNATASVVRIGATVRKPWTAKTALVQDLVEHVRARGVDAPAPLGRDEQGRQILEFVPGAGPEVLDTDDLNRIGRMVRGIHDAAASFPFRTTDAWDVLLPAPDQPELICHGDVAPWNLIVGDRWVFIDWDGAGPSTRLWDLAYSASAFTLNDPAQDPQDAGARLAAFIAGYDADDGMRSLLPAAMAQRTAAMLRMLGQAHDRGEEPWGSMYVEGHGAHWRAVTEYVRAHEAVWRDALG
ncbi:phosphotransferase [Microbacterium sp. KUDC0406]|uniref:phosphotransferase enzyme family protein n=1 Tax=Microbacterium sp. KUDC0406 TaxID=2909588 RepID=UPI001F2F4B04|nr:phosphotransferase [Microbacterium sp. KUDC0406]UJP11527.1 phosphotransferase [Microbacterium sp. KUDC0406]